MKLIIFVCTLVLLSCKKENKEVKLIDTQIINKEPLKIDTLKSIDCIIDYNLYSNLDYISLGNSWFDENLNKEYIYRIIVSSVGEEAYLYKELFEIKEDGPIQFISRKKIDPKEIGLQYFESTPIFRWDSYNFVTLTISDKNYRLQLNGESTN